jgi:hypothetical protein
VAVLDDFMRLDAGAEQWDDPAFAHVLTDFKRRFRQTNTEEGVVMETGITPRACQTPPSERAHLS